MQKLRTSNSVLKIKRVIGQERKMKMSKEMAKCPLRPRAKKKGIAKEIA